MKKTEIDILFKSGKKIYTKNFKLVWMPSTDSNVIISAPVKIFKKAVDRNRVKRLIREAIRGLDFSNKNVFVIYTSKEIITLKEMKDELWKLKI